MSYKSLQDLFVREDQTIRTALATISKAGVQLCLVTEPSGRLTGVVSDGDIRGGFLRGCTPDHLVREVMNRTPKLVQQGTPREQVISLMRSHRIRQIPVVDPQGQVVGLEILDEFLEKPQHDELVVLMAGGRGSRLRPLTNLYPKPLLKVGGKPILEWVVEGFVQQGFSQFLLSVNYKAEMIKTHFGKGEAWNANIDYLVEEERMGTAGALRLIKERPKKPFFVMNSDLLTKVNFKHVLDFHEAGGNLATMCVQEYDVQVPYGVVESKENAICSIVEKPTYHYQVNSGIYVFSPEALDYLPSDPVVDIPSFFTALIASGGAVRSFPIHGFWLDVGRKEDLRRAREEFEAP